MLAAKGSARTPLGPKCYDVGNPNLCLGMPDSFIKEYVCPKDDKIHAYFNYMILAEMYYLYYRMLMENLEEE